MSQFILAKNKYTGKKVAFCLPEGYYFVRPMFSIRNEEFPSKIKISCEGFSISMSLNDFKEIVMGFEDLEEAILFARKVLAANGVSFINRVADTVILWRKEYKVQSIEE